MDAGIDAVHVRALPRILTRNSSRQDLQCPSCKHDVLRMVFPIELVHNLDAGLVVGRPYLPHLDADREDLPWFEGQTGRSRL